MSFLDVFSSVTRSIGGLMISIRFDRFPLEKPNVPPEYKWFKPEEVEGLNEQFVTQLDNAREIAGIPFVITSGFRTPEKNQSVPGAVSDSAHLKGLAVDIRVQNAHEVALISDAAKKVGITRRLVYVDRNFDPVHMHIDVDPDKVDDIIKVLPEPKSWAEQSAPATA